MDEAVKQYQFLLDISPQDLRLINWHHANLEYANAANVGKLSLGEWDQDAGNEFEGVHAQVIGGYQQVPRGILQSPTKLDLRTRIVVRQIARRTRFSRLNRDGLQQPTHTVPCGAGESWCSESSKSGEENGNPSENPLKRGDQRVDPKSWLGIQD